MIRLGAMARPVTRTAVVVWMLGLVSALGVEAQAAAFDTVCGPVPALTAAAYPAVVAVHAVGRATGTYKATQDGAPQWQVGTGNFTLTGRGVVVGPLVVTAAHVVYPATVTLGHQRQPTTSLVMAVNEATVHVGAPAAANGVPAEIVHISHSYDLAILRPKDPAALRALPYQPAVTWVRTHSGQGHSLLQAGTCVVALVPERPARRRSEAEQDYLANQDSIADLQTQLKQLESDVKQLESQAKSFTLQSLETSTSRKNQLQERRSQIALLELQLAKHSEIVSQHDGRILELTVHVGQVIETGLRLGSMQVEESASRLVGLTYFPIKTGKKIQPGMTIRVAPDTVKPERFGSIVGTVTTVSAFPVTKEGIANLIGNAEVVKTLVGQGPVIEVGVELAQAPSTFSGYKWSSSQGPTLQITSGTTTVGRVMLAQRAPITYLLPLLREISGLY